MCHRTPQLHSSDRLSDDITQLLLPLIGDETVATGCPRHELLWKHIVHLFVEMHHMPAPALEPIRMMCKLLGVTKQRTEIFLCS